MKLRRCLIEHICQRLREKNVKSLDESWGLDMALYKKVPLCLPFLPSNVILPTFSVSLCHPLVRDYVVTVSPPSDCSSPWCVSCVLSVSVRHELLQVSSLGFCSSRAAIFNQMCRSERRPGTQQYQPFI